MAYLNEVTHEPFFPRYSGILTPFQGAGAQDFSGHSTLKRRFAAQERRENKDDWTTENTPACEHAPGR